MKSRPSRFALAQSIQPRKCSGRSSFALDPPAAGLGVAGVQVEAVACRGSATSALSRSARSSSGGAGLARVVAGDGQPAADRLARCPRSRRRRRPASSAARSATSPRRASARSTSTPELGVSLLRQLERPLDLSRPDRHVGYSSPRTRLGADHVAPRTPETARGWAPTGEVARQCRSRADPGSMLLASTTRGPSVPGPVARPPDNLRHPRHRRESPLRVARGSFTAMVVHPPSWLAMSGERAPEA